MIGQPCCRRGSLLVEVSISVAVLGVMVALALSATLSFSKTQDHYHQRLAALWAAEAQMERYLGGAALDSNPPGQMLAREITLATTVEPGSGEWSAFNLVTVTARLENRRGKPIVESVRCYLARGTKP